MFRQSNVCLAKVFHARSKGRREFAPIRTLSRVVNTTRRGRRGFAFKPNLNRGTGAEFGVREAVNVAKLARGQIKEHLTLLDTINGQLKRG